MNFIDSGFQYLIELGFFTTLVPFLLFFGITFGILQRIKLFGTEGKQYNMVFAFCLSFFTIYNFTITDKLPEFIARMAFFMVIILAVLILAGLLGVESKYKGTTVIIVILLYIVYSALETFFPGLLFEKIKLGISGTVIAGIAAVVVFIGIIYFVAGSSSGNGDSSRSGSSGGGSSRSSSNSSDSNNNSRSNETKPSSNSSSENPSKPRPKPKNLDEEFTYHDGETI